MNFDAVTPHPLDEEVESGGIVWNPASPYVKEMRKWEMNPSEWTVKSKPGNPYVYHEFPKMLYKPQRLPTGRFACMMETPDPYAFARPDEFNRAVVMKESFDRTCQRIVRDESQERLAAGQGWRDTVAKAMELHEQNEQAIGNAAAEAAFAAARMSERAREEFKAAGESTHQHVADVTKSKRGSKAVVANEEE